MVQTSQNQVNVTISHDGNSSSGSLPQIIENRVSEMLIHHVPRSVVHNGQSIEATQVSIGGRVLKQNSVCLHSGLMFSLQKEGNPNMGES